MNEYERATRYLYGLKKFGSRPGLERITRLLELLGNPQSNLKVILVGGTSGKGSTCKFIESILREAGYKVGLFTKPHLSAFTERFVVNGRRISEEKVAEFVGMAKPLCRKLEEHPTFFEMNTALAYDYFAKNEVDFAVMEVGMGGRLDSTNVVVPLVSVVTNVGLEHTKILGDTVAKIAREKAGIVREGGVLITASDDPEALRVFRDVCSAKKARLVLAGGRIISSKSHGLSGQEFTDKKYGKLKIRLLGGHQLKNAAVALHAIEEAPVKTGKTQIRNGLLKARWPGRLEVVRKKPLVLLDCAKDPLSMGALRESLLPIKRGKLFLVLSISSDKKISMMLDAIMPIVDSVVVTKHGMMGRAALPRQLARTIRSKFPAVPVMVVNNPKHAVENALRLASPRDTVCITGSMFLVAEARELWFPKKGGKAKIDSLNA